MKSNKKTITINIREDIIEAVKKIANANDRSASYISEQLIIMGLKSAAEKGKEYAKTKNK